jgi:hypothetical protein
MAIENKNVSQGNEFAKQAESAPTGAVSDFWYFLRHNKKWWLTPIVLLIVLFGVLVVLGGTGAAPFIYTLF